MSKTKSGGSTKWGRDSRPKYLGVKIFAGQRVKAGAIIVRQRGTKFIAGKNVRRGKDDSLYAIREGTVNFQTKRMLKFSGKKKVAKIVNVE